MSDLLNSASLVMIPSGYKEDVVYSQIPTDGSGDLSFTRASNGTRVNSAGLVEVCPWNLLQQSETLSASPWGVADVTITDNSQTAPNGTNTADVLTEGTGSGQHRIYQTTSFASGVYTLSVYVKNITGTRQAYIDLGPVTGFFNFATETIYSATAIASFEKLANGWYRIALTTANAITLSTIYLGLGQSNNETYTGNGTSAIAFYGAQLNIGSTAKPYFPTTDRLNVPRLTYQNGGGGCPSLLLEKQSTNGVYPSEDFTNANWQNYGGASVTANTAISPDGTQNADTLDSGTSTALYNPNGVSGGAIPFTASIYVKKVNFDVFRFGMTDDTLEEFSYNYNLDTGAISAATTPSVWTSTSGTITSVGNGWYRLTVTGTKGVLGAARMVVKGQSSSKQYYIWGAQLEASSYATSYIPTTSSSATRVADACYKTGISSLIGQTEGVLFADVNLTTRQSFTYISISNAGSSANYIGIYFRAAAIEMEVVNGGVLQGNVQYSNTSTGRFKIAIGYKQNDFVLYVNGTQIGTDTSGTIPTCDRLDLFGFNDNQPLQVNETILFPTRLTNAELASLTTL